MKKLLILAALILVLGIGGIIWWTQGFRPPEPNNNEQVSFVISPGENVREIGSQLKEQGLIRDPIVFFLYVRQEGLDKNIQAGSYILSPSMTLTEVVQAFKSGSIDVWVRIPEGSRAEEVAAILEGSLQNFDDTWRQTLVENEGRLFPDTYLIPKDAEIEDVIRIVDENFMTRLSSGNIDANREDIQRILTIASLIEREAKNEEDRPIVASVIENRLELGMPLQIDATVQYALGTPRNWWTPPTAEDLQVDSPYNTYQNTGLPPGPIANPSLSSITAAANPESTNYIYYVNDEEGKLHFAEDLDTHNSNIERYLQ